MNTVSARFCKDHVLISSGGHRFRVGQPDQVDGETSCPKQLILVALSACIMLTIKAVATHKGIQLVKPQVHVEPWPDGGTHFQVTLKLDGHLTDRERKILYQSARTCQVSKILKDNIQVDYRLDERDR